MTQSTRYSYLGVNGTIVSPVLLEGIYSVKKILLCADDDKLLTKDGKHFVPSVVVAENEVEQWYEVNK